MINRLSGALKSMINHNMIDIMGHEYVAEHLLALTEMGGMIPPNIYDFDKDTYKEELSSFEWESEDE